MWDELRESHVRCRSNMTLGGERERTGQGGGGREGVKVGKEKRGGCEVRMVGRGEEKEMEGER